MDRSQYLALAQLCQDFIDRIINYLEDGDWPPLHELAVEWSGSLSGVPNPQMRGSRAAFGSYEYLKTLNEVWDRSQAENVRRAVADLSQLPDSNTARDAAEQLIRPFEALATQALWNFQQPELEVPRGILELCQPT
jgi:hypothetical protein